MDPGAAIQCFERLHGVMVTVHDPQGRFIHRLPAASFRHGHRLCESTKAAGHLPACTRFDLQHVRESCLRHPQGFTKTCHAGLVELVVPHIEHGVVCWLLFAGPWRDAPGLTVEVRAPSAGLHLRGGEPPPADLADRLQALRWLAAHLAAAAPPPLPAPDTRHEIISAFLERRHGDDVGIADLAAALGVSPSRASHVVAELTGSTFAALLARTRLDAARHLLRHTDVPVMQVALRAGFGDLSHFHAVFRRAHQTSPAVWRRAQAEV